MRFDVSINGGLPLKLLEPEVGCAIATLALLEQAGRYREFKKLRQMIVTYFEDALSNGCGPSRGGELLDFAKRAVGTMH